VTMSDDAASKDSGAAEPDAAKQEPEPPAEPVAAEPAEPAPSELGEPVSDAAADDTAAAAEMRHRWRIFTIIALISLIADQATKIWARASLPTMVLGHPTGPNGTCAIPADLQSFACQGKPVDVIDSFWHWRLSMNPGSAFGLFSSGGMLSRVVLSLVAIGAVIGMFVMLKKARPDQKILHWALALIAAGAIGNLIDRLYYGVVTDFILWHVGDRVPNGFTWEHEWPVFNVADIVLVIGVGLMVIDMLQDWKLERVKRLRRREKAKAAGLIRDL
jgi:signal peptidase II